MKLSVLFALTPIAISPIAAASAPFSGAPALLDAKVEVTSEGDFLVGNSDAQVKLVEYGSLSCPGCQGFYSEGMTPVRQAIEAGKVSFEFRPFMIDWSDLIIHQLMVCAGPKNFLSFSEDFYRFQSDLMVPYKGWKAKNPSLGATAVLNDLVTYSDQWGFTGFSIAHGLSLASAHQCLSDKTSVKLAALRQIKARKEMNIPGTPTLLLQGKVLPNRKWSESAQTVMSLVD